MFFLLRVAFWLTIVLALLPSGKPLPGSQVGAGDAMAAAGAAVSDVGQFCERQPDACEIGAQAAVAIGQRAQAGAKMVYEFINEQVTDDGRVRTATGSVSARTVSVVHTAPPFAGSQSTLRASDLAPAWRGPQARTETVPLPRPRQRLHRVPRPDPRRRAAHGARPQRAG